MHEVTKGTVAYIREARHREMEPTRLQGARIRTLDVLIAMISGRSLPAGETAHAYALAQQAQGRVSIVGSGDTTNLVTGVFANAMAAHANETDDVNNLARLHPGACVVPAALGMAQHVGASGIDLLRSVSLGYDVACSVNMTAWTSLTAMQAETRSPHGLGGAFGAAAAAMMLADLDEDACASALSYTGQQASGVLTFYRDTKHIGKAFATAAMQASAGVRAADLAAHGFTDIHDMLDGEPNLFDAFGDRHDPTHLLVEFEHADHVNSTDLKLYPIGMPIQAAAEAMENILAQADLKPDDIGSIECRLPPHPAKIVNQRTMPDINLQYILSCLVIDGKLTFARAHDYDGPEQPEIQALMQRVSLVADPSLDPPDDVDVNARSTRIADLTVVLRDGTELHDRVNSPRGSRLRPAAWTDLERKAHMALEDIRTTAQVEELIDVIAHLETLEVADLIPVIGSASSDERAGR